MTRRVLALAAAATAFGGCQPISNICGRKSEPVQAPDGGPQRCVVAEDCPRPSNVLVCVTDRSLEAECMSCEDTHCIRYVPELCQ